MGDSIIGWTNKTWNPVVGCTRVSAGCDHCYAFDLHDGRFVKQADAAKRLIAGRGVDVAGMNRQALIDRARDEGIALPFAARQYDRPFSTVQLIPERLEQPLSLARPARIFVNSLSDVFHEHVPDGYVARIFAVMALAGWHTFQVLTKRPERARDLLTGRSFWLDVRRHHAELAGRWTRKLERRGRIIHELLAAPDAVPANVWLGTSVEDQRAADERIPLLLETPAAVRFISAEPLLGPVDLTRWLSPMEQLVQDVREHPERRTVAVFRRLDWVIVGGESGPHFRPMPHRWARDIRDQCVAAGVAFFFKQSAHRFTERGTALEEEDGSRWEWHQYPGDLAAPVQVRAATADPLTVAP